MENVSGKHAITLLCVLLGVWLAWSGIYEPLLISFGVFSVILTVYVTASLKSLDQEGQPLHWIFQMIWYVPWLLKEIVLANLDVIKRVLSPKLSEPNNDVISPTWVKVQVPQNSRLGLSLFANSITLTPGTVSVDTGAGYIWVHALSSEGAESLLGNEGGEMGKQVLKVERQDG